MTDTPLISIIIVCKNPGLRLHAAVESVTNQSLNSIELIVIDGASTDGTREWLEAHRHRLTTYVSERDSGIYDAMNKGLALARGEWVLFLGADDRLAAPDTLESVAQSLTNTPASIVVGEARFDDGRLYPFTGIETAIRRNFVHHQAAFYRRTLFDKHGGFDTTLRIQADYDYNLRLLQSGEIFASTPLRISNCASGGLSDSGRWANYHEERIVRHRHFPAANCWAWDVCSVIRYLRKKVVLTFC